MEVVWTEDAILDLEYIRQGIDANDSGAAQHLATLVDEKVSLLASNPRLGERYGTDTDRRLVITRRCIVFYRIRPAVVVISSIRHTSRRPLLLPDDEDEDE